MPAVAATALPIHGDELGRAASSATRGRAWRGRRYVAARRPRAVRAGLLWVTSRYARIAEFVTTGSVGQASSQPTSSASIAPVSPNCTGIPAPAGHSPAFPRESRNSSILSGCWGQIDGAAVRHGLPSLINLQETRNAAKLNRPLRLSPRAVGDPARLSGPGPRRAADDAFPAGSCSGARGSGVCAGSAVNGHTRQTPFARITGHVVQPPGVRPENEPEERS